MFHYSGCLGESGGRLALLLFRNSCLCTSCSGVSFFAMFLFKIKVFEIYIDKEKQKNEIARRRKFACVTFLTNFFLKRNLIIYI